MDGEALYNKIKSHSGSFGLEEVVKTYRAYRGNEKGETKHVTVEVLFDADAEFGQRWSVVATDEDGRIASGNPGSTAETALALVQWHELDGPARGEFRRWKHLLRRVR